MKKIIILGATGSIGKSALDIVRSYPGRFQVTALSCHSQGEQLRALAREFGVTRLALSGVADDDIPYTGEAGLLRMIEETDADCVVNGISGAAGFLPSVKTIESGKTLALANKETLVMAGSLVKELAARHKTAIIPVDSEHSAVFQMVRAFGADAVNSVILTASGGPFRDLPKEKLAHVTPDDALRHPTWSMGKKITIDSASLANKGLEVIEAHHLFDLPP
ncbi:MAG: 1-deoxy-D-xylulose-5-phosphate reductoisomerase, partial [Spirochaetales bacterium]|nr:1-deoxy-D-xylulose-5-phosphate reductoisomerase [Spirochaetales bacterium]